MNAWARFEPLLWLLFMAGGIAAALLLPSASFVFGIASPAGWLGDAAQSYQRLRALLGGSGVQVFVAALQSLIFWHAAHQVRRVLRSFWVENEPLVCGVCYGLAALASAVSFAVWCRI